MLKRVLMALSMSILAGLGAANAQSLSVEDLASLAKTEDSLILVADSMYNAFIPDERPVYCERFVRQLVRALRTPNSWTYSFSKLSEKINIITAPDNGFRIFNWIVPQEPRGRYYGAIQMPSEDLKLYPLVDCATELGKTAEDTILTDSRWFGALYYRIVANEVNGQKVYTLFGLNAASPISNKKVLDPLLFTEKGPVFGAPVFNVSSEAHPAQRVNRFIIEYKKDVQASMNWDEDKKMIYFDRLVSQVNDPNRKYTYVPSGQYDGFRWIEGSWNYIQDLIPIQTFKDGEAPAPKPFK